MMSMNRRDAAIHLKLTIDQFDDLMTRSDMIDAWIRGRAKITATVHAAMIQKALEGNVTAQKEVLRRLDLNRDDIVTIDARARASDAAMTAGNAAAGDAGSCRQSQRCDLDTGTGDGRSTLRVTDFAGEFERLMKARRAGGAA